MSLITAAIEDTLNGLPDDIREECILAIKSKRNNSFRNNQSNSQQNYYNNQGSNNGQGKNKNKGQNGKKNRKIKILIIQTTTLSHAGTVTRRGTHKLNAILESEKINQ
jgi:hypothetical protein